jgi:hypothetical protein
VIRPTIRPTLIVALLALGSGCASKPAPPPDIALDFHALWSPAGDSRQESAIGTVGGLRETTLTTWNTDRDHPHPDIVNAQIRIANSGDARRRATVIMLHEEWRIGAADGDEGAASWSERSQRASPPVDLVPGEPVSLSMPIAVGEMVRRQTKAGRVPWRLAVRAELRDASNSQTLATAQATLQIVAGPG